MGDSVETEFFYRTKRFIGHLYHLRGEMLSTETLFLNEHIIFFMDGKIESAQYRYQIIYRKKKLHH